MKNKIREETGCDFSKLIAKITFSTVQKIDSLRGKSFQCPHSSINSVISSEDLKGDGIIDLKELKKLIGQIEADYIRKLEQKKKEWSDIVNAKDIQLHILQREKEEAYKEIANFREKLKLAEDFKQKVVEQPEDKEQIENFQMQELSKTKHLVLLRDSQLVYKNSSPKDARLQLEKMRSEFARLRREEEHLSDIQIEKIELKDGTKNSETDSDSAPDVAPLAEVCLLTKIIRKGLVHNKNYMEIQRQNPNSPLHPVQTFEALNLDPNLLKGIYDMGFNAPSKIQGAALPMLLAVPSQNLIVQSQPGTGKTAAFVLAMLGKVDATKKYPQILCLSPTYESAIDTGEVVAHMAKFCPEIEMKYAVRGEEVPRGMKLTEHIIIGTPGKVMDWAVKYRVFDLKKIFVFVLDVADVMIAQQGHQDQCIRIHKELGQNCQMMFFSASYDHEVMDFAQVIVKNPIIIIEEESLDNIQQYYVKCLTQESKYRALTNICETVGVGQAIIFCHTRKTANWLSEKMTRDGHAVAVLTGDLTVEQRINVLDRFRNGQEKVLITTNVLSTGIYVEQVTIVVNFDLPVDMNGKADCDTYLRRICRTGRFGKHGVAINLVDSRQSMTICQSIEQHFNSKIKYLNAEDSDEIEKIVGALTARRHVTYF